MSIAGSYVDHSGQRTHLHRRDAQCCRPVAQLSVAVLAPRPHRAIVLERKAMIAAGGDNLDIGESGDLRRVTEYTLKSAAQLPGSVGTPPPYRPVILACEAMTSTRGNRVDVGHSIHFVG